MTTFYTLVYRDLTMNVIFFSEGVKFDPRPNFSHQ